MNSPALYYLQVALRTPEESSREACWRAGPQTVRRIEALAPSALLEVHVGPRSTRYYKEVRVGKIPRHHAAP